MLDEPRQPTRPKTYFSLVGKKVVVTGAAGGIGAPTVKICIDAGADIVLVDMMEEAGARARIAAAATLPYFQCNVADRVAVDAVAKKISQVDAVIDTVGIAPFDDFFSDDDWDEKLDRVMDVNVRGPMNIARAFYGHVRPGGSMAFCGSIAGWHGGVRGPAHYAASKGALHAFIRWLSQRATKRGIRVNAVAPGTVDTPMTHGHGYDPSYYPQGRFAEPGEVGAVLAFLSMPASGFMSGTILDINGGTYIR